MARTRSTQSAPHPVARFVREAPQAVDVAGLLAVALDVPPLAAVTLLDQSGGTVRGLSALPHATVAGVPGMTAAAADRLRAVLELAYRHAGEAIPERAPARGPRDIAAHCARMGELPVEEFHVLVLDAQHRITRDITVTRGILDSSLVHPREVFREVIAERAAAVVLVHNHPSGDPTPSSADREVTTQLVAAGRLLDIPVHDHVIIGRGRYVSFAEAGLL